MGGSPVECGPPDACQAPSTCDSGTGICSGAPLPDGSPCQDGDPCTGGDTCQQGECTAGESSCPPDPATVAPPLDQSIQVDLADLTDFLFTGPDPIQQGVDPDALIAERRALLRGVVRDRDGAPIPAAAVTVVDHPEFGITHTRTDGRYDLAVNGGETLTVSITHLGFLDSHRSVTVDWQEGVEVPEVVLIPLDEAVTIVAPETASTVEVVRGSVVSDEDGARRPTLLFEPGTRVTMSLPGETRILDQISVRATEYTVGETGPAAMPGSLPGTSGYTYAVEYTVDEALAEGATSVEFSRPVATYLENFLDIPVGGAVPTGFYDREKAQWIPSADGRVVAVVGISNGLAELDIDGDGAADGDDELATLQVTAGERARLAELYGPGTSLWRVLIDHFTPWDCNWPYGLPDGAELPPDEEPVAAAQDEDQERDCGSIIGCQNQTLGEDLSLAGTALRLRYQSDRVQGRKVERTIDIPLSGPTLPPELLRIDAEVTVAGLRTPLHFAPQPNLRFAFTWNGQDAYGRVLQGRQTAHVSVSYVYPAVRRRPAELAASFAMVSEQGGAIGRNSGRTELYLTRSWSVPIGSFYSEPLGLGGWTFDVHHAFDPIGNILYEGTGEFRALDSTPLLFAGTGVAGDSGDGGGATSAQMNQPSALAAGPDGAVFVADTGNDAIRRIARDGTITSIARAVIPGELIQNSSAEQPLNNGELPGWTEVLGTGWTKRFSAPDPADGSAYFFAGANALAELRQDIDVSADAEAIDASRRRYRFRGLVRSFNQLPGDTSQIVVEYRDAANALVLAAFDSGEIFNRFAWQEVADTRLAPVGTRWVRVRLVSRRRSGSNNDGYFDKLSLTASNVDDPVASTLSDPAGIAVGENDEVLVADTGNHRLIAIDLQGGSTLRAGTGLAGYAGDGGRAEEAQLSSPRGLALAPDGVIYVADTGNHCVRRIGLDGIITTLAGSGTAGSSGDGGPARAALLSSPTGVAVAPDGAVYVADSGNQRIRQIGPDGVIRRFAGSGTAGYAGDGGPATDARLSAPTGVTIGIDGSIYIADTGNQRLRRVLPDGRIRTVARAIPGGSGGDPGTGAFLTPVGVATAGSSVVVADSGLHMVRKIASLHPLTAPSGERLVQSIDGDSLYGFAADGRHLHTYSARAGTLLLAFSYDAMGRLTGVSDRFGNTTAVERDAAGRPTAIVGPFGHRTTLSLRPDGYLETVTDPVGDSVTFDYRFGGLLTDVTDGKGFIHTYDYDDLGRLIDDVGPVGRTRLDRSGSANDYTIELTSALGLKTRHRLTKQQGAESAGCPDPTDGECQRRTMTFAHGGVTQTFVSPQGRDTTMAPDGSRADADEAREGSLGLVYPGRLKAQLPSGRQLVTDREETLELADPSNPLGPRRATHALTLRAGEAAAGDTWQTVFDSEARTITRTSPSGRATVTTIDALHRVVRTHVAGIVHDVEYDWDDRGRLRAVTQGERHTEYEYRESDGTLSKVKMQIGVDGETPLFEEHAIGVDADGRPVELTYPDGAVLGLGYDGNGNLDELTPPGKPTHHSDHGPGDLIATYRPPLLADGQLRQKSFAYDAEGDIQTLLAPDGTTITYHYQTPSGRLERVELPAPWGAVSIAYETATAAGRVSGLTRTDPLGASTLSFVHDGPEIVSTHWDSDWIRGTVAYDRSQITSGRVVTETVCGTPVQYRFDSDRLLTQAGAMTVAHRPDTGLRESRTIGCVADLVVANAYGDRDSLSASCNGSPLLSTQYIYDRLGRIETLTESVAGAPAVTKTYTYDPRGRLEAVSENGFEIARYDYDVNDNRVGSPGEIVVDAHDQLLAQDERSYTYTLNGEVATATDPSGTTAYTYDPFGTLRRVDLPSGDVVEYLVDPADRRIAKLVNGSFETGFLYGANNRPVARLDAAGAVAARFVYGTGITPDYFVQQGQTYALVTDHLGSVRLVVNAATGAIAQRIDYDEFGQVLLDTNPGFQPFGFAGGLYDPDTHLVQFGAREYDPRTGRFTTLEPLGFAQSGNRYTYVGADPINRIDPTGLSWIDWSIWNYLDPVSDAAAGFGDAISFGATRKIRKALDVDDVVSPCSLVYRIAGYAGEMLRDELLGIAALKAAGRAWRAARRSTQEGRETFQILDGVRRSKAAEIAGKTSIEAEIHVGGRVVGTQEIALDALLSPKSSISTQGSGLTRWLDTLRQTLQGSKPPPITVTPGPRGTPIRDVLVD